MSKDPIGFDGGTNLYSYCGQDPTNCIDPTGEFGLWGVVIGAGFEIAVQAATIAANGGDPYDYNNYDGSDILISAAFGFVSPGVFSTGKNVVKSAGAITTLTGQLNRARTANRVNKINTSIVRNKKQIVEALGVQAAFQVTKYGAKKLDEVNFCR